MLVARAALDYERAAAHALVVRATDGVTGAFADAAVTLRVLDVNDCAPELDRDVYRASVSEAAAVGDLVITVHATDNDTGNLLFIFLCIGFNFRVKMFSLRKY